MGGRALRQIPRVFRSSAPLHDQYLATVNAPRSHLYALQYQFTQVRGAVPESPGTLAVGTRGTNFLADPLYRLHTDCASITMVFCEVLLLLASCKVNRK